MSLATYYYEIVDGKTVFGESHRYWCQPKYDAGVGYGWQKEFHLRAWQNSVNIWVENTNGVTKIINNRRECWEYTPRHRLDDLKEFVWMKIQAEVVPECD